MNENEMNLEPMENEMPVQKKKGKLGILLAAIAAVVVIAVALAVVLPMMQSPAALVATGIEKSGEALQANTLLPFFTRLEKGGSMDVQVDVDTLLASLYGVEDALQGDASVKIYTGEEKAVVSVGVKMEQMDEMDAKLYLTTDSLAIGSQWLLGEEAYGVSLENLAENFANSPFGMNGKYSLGIEIPEEFEVVLQKSLKFRKDTEVVVKELTGVLAASLVENAQMEKADGSLQFQSAEVKTTAVTVTLDQTQLKAVITDLLEHLRTDADVKKFVEENAEYMYYLENQEFPDEEEAKEYVDTVFAELAEADLQELEESKPSCQAVCHINKSNKQLIGVEITLEAEGEKITGTVCAGPDLKKAEQITVNISDGTENYQVSCLVKTNDKETYEATLQWDNDTQEAMTGHILWNKQDGAWEFKMDDGAGEVVVKGNCAFADDKLTFRVDSVTVADETVNLGIAVVYTAEDPMPTIDGYTDLLTMDDAEIEAFLTEIFTVLEAFAA